jgi:hypothetical protein
MASIVLRLTFANVEMSEMAFDFRALPLAWVFAFGSFVSSGSCVVVVSVRTWPKFTAHASFTGVAAATTNLTPESRPSPAAIRDGGLTSGTRNSVGRAGEEVTD